MGYNGSVELISGLIQKNNGNFALVDASAVRVDDDTRLDAALANKADAEEILELKNIFDSCNSETATGAPCIFTDGQASTRAINCIVDLSGETDPTVTVLHRGRNLLSPVPQRTSYGMTYAQTVNGIHISGAVANPDTNNISITLFNDVLPSGKYFFPKLSKIAGGSTYQLVIDGNGTTKYVSQNDTIVSIDAPQTIRVRLFIYAAGREMDVTIPAQMLYLFPGASVSQIQQTYFMPQAEEFTISGTPPVPVNICASNIVNVFDGYNILWCKNHTISMMYLANAIHAIKNLTNAVSPKDFGAYGDGIYDDTSAIQSCIDYAIARNVDVIFPHGAYAVRTININGSVYIDFANSELICCVPNDVLNASVIYVEASTEAGKRGCIHDVRINCKGRAKYGIYVEQNINALTFDNIQINEVSANGYGIYTNSGGGGKFSNIIIRCNVQENNEATGFHLEAPDSTVQNAMVVNCKYGAYTTALSQFINFHPWNSFPSLMTTSVGFHTTSMAMITSSYIDTCAKCFDGTGYFFIDGLVLFWSSGYYTDESVGDETIRPIIFSGNTRPYQMVGVRVYKPRGRSDEQARIQFAENKDNCRIFFDPRKNNLLEAVDGIPKVAYQEYNFISPGSASDNNPIDESSILRRYSDRVELFLKVTTPPLNKNTNTLIATIPSDCFPHFQLMPVVSAVDEMNAMNTYTVLLTVRGKAQNNSGGIFARIIGDNVPTDNTIIYWTAEYHIN